MRMLTLPLTFLLSFGVAQAGTLNTNVTGTIYDYVHYTLPANCSATGTSSAACSNGTPPAYVNLTANADYGNLSGTASGAYPPIYLSSLASFDDLLTITSTGTPAGFVDFTFQLVGKAQSSSSGLGVTVYQNNTNILNALPYITNPFLFNGVNLSYTTPEVAFASGVPFEFGMSAEANTAFLSGGGPGSGGPYNDNFQVTLTGISVFDSTGNPITSGVTIFSPSSTYGGLVTISSTPEPSTFFLVPLTLAALIWRSRCVTGFSLSVQ